MPTEVQGESPECVSLMEKDSLTVFDSSAPSERFITSDYYVEW